MTEHGARIRLHVTARLAAGQPAATTADQAHYLRNVMRLAPGAPILAFNSTDGEWLARILELGKRGAVLMPERQTRAPELPPDVWLLFAPIKKARTDFIVEKAAEMGARRILPVRTERTNAERIRRDRLQAHAIEAAEQCGNVFVPEVAELAPLERVLEAWPEGRRLMFCDEALAGSPPDLAALSATGAAGGWAILIGPEGGFSEAERARLAALPFGHRIGLGPRVLRADTAAVAALTVWQLALGDWREPARPGG